MFTALNVISVILALIVGIFGLSLVFVDLGPDGLTFGRVILGVGFFLLVGLIIGFINPKGWWISGFAAWGGILIGGFITINAIKKYGGDAWSANEPPYILSGLALLFFPLGLALVGGYLGKFLRIRRQKSLDEPKEST